MHSSDPRLRARLTPPAVLLAALALSACAWSRPTVEIEGAPNRATRAALRDALPDRDRPQTPLEAERLAEEAAEIARVFARSEGWYDADIVPEADVDPPRARLTLDLGPRYGLTLPIVTYDAPPAPEAAAAVADVLDTLEPGAPGRAGDVIAVEGAAVGALRNQGYPDARARDRRAVVDHAARTLSLTYAFAPGDRARLGALRIIAGADDIRPGLADTLQTWPHSALYSPARLARTRNLFDDTGVFSSVGVTLADDDGDPETPRDVLVALEEGEPRSLGVGASYSTLEGFGVDASFAYRNALRRLETLSATFRLAELEQRLGLSARVPHALGPGEALTASAEIAREDLEPFERIGARLAVGVETTPRPRVRLGYGATLSADVFDTAAAEQDVYTLAGYAEIRRERIDQPLDPRDGDVIIARAEPGVAFGDDAVGFLRSTLEGRVYETFLADRLTLAGRAQAGWVQPFGADAGALPLNRRFFAGGGGSVRGYEFNSIFPGRERLQEDPPGGQGLFEVSFETRVRLTDTWGFVTFADGGAAFDDFGEATNLLWGVGAGLRYDLGFAPLRFDIATPLDRGGPNQQAVVVYISLGQSF